MKYNKFRDIPRYIRANYQVDYPLSYFEKWLKEEEEEAGLQLNPDFQRGHVWTEAQQIAYIEFLLRGGKTGRDLYFNYPEIHHKNEVSNYTDYVCVDGLQRITSILRFLHSEIPAFGTLYKDYEDSLRAVDDTVRIHINDLPTKEEVLRWYLEMNAGGTPHSADEINRVNSLLAHEKANNYLRQQAAARGWDYFTIEDDTHKGSNSLTLVGFADQGAMRAGTDALGRICVSCNIFDEEFTQR